MKRLIPALLALLLAMTLFAIPVSAAEGSAALSAGAAESKYPAALILSLSGFAEADTIGVKITAEEGLVLDRANSSWLLAGTLTDVDSYGKGDAAWTGNAATVNTQVLKLAFTVPAHTAQKSTYSVSVSVTVKKGATVVGTASASATVTARCTLVETPAKAPSCTAEGNNAYHTCTLCGKVYKADKTTLTTVAAETLPITHTYQWVIDKAATDMAPGVKHEECTCGARRSENTPIPQLDHVHTGITKHEAVKATCTKEGTLAYWTCSGKKCQGIAYGDAACTQVLSSTVEPKNPANHTGGTELKAALEPTCAKEGYSGDTWCLGCKTLITKGQTLAATGKHTPKKDYLISDTQHWQECSVCGGVIGEKTNHTNSWVVEKQPTESAEGLRAEACTACGRKTGKTEAIAKLPHIPGLVAGKAATCETEGLLEHFFCPNCGGYYASEGGKVGTKIAKDAITLKALGHSFGTEWKTDEKGHWHVCTACGKEDAHEAHKPELKGAVEPTETQTGYSGDSICQVCDRKLQEGQELPTVTVPPTTLPPVTEAPAAPQAPAGQSGGDTLVWILGGVALLGGSAAALLILLGKRRKKS